MKHETIAVVRERERERVTSTNVGLFCNAKIIYKYKLKRIEYCIKQQINELYIFYNILSFLNSKYQQIVLKKYILIV